MKDWQRKLNENWQINGKLIGEELAPSWKTGGEVEDLWDLDCRGDGGSGRLMWRWKTFREMEMED